jgi:ubiquinone biosynthesis protein UbiJ
MATQSPDSFLGSFFDRLGQALQPPDWMIREMQHRLVLLLNHVLQQEPEAQARLKRQASRIVEAHWRQFSVRLQATPAGLLDLAPPGAPPDLTVTLADESPFGLAQTAMRGEKPPVRIAGDVQLAAEVQWLVDHVRWDIEEDLARVFGDAPAHAIGEVGRRLTGALRQFVGRGRDDAGPGKPPTPAAPGQAGG